MRRNNAWGFNILVAEPNQRLEHNLIAETVILAQFQDLGSDEALDQPKDIGVGAALDLADEPLFVGRQGRERIGQGKPVRQEFVGEIEMAPPNDVLVPARNDTKAAEGWPSSS